MSSSGVFFESFDRLAGVKTEKVTSEDIDALRHELTRVMQSHGHRRTLIEQDFSEIVVEATRSARYEHLFESKEGIKIVAKIAGDVISDMVMTAISQRGFSAR